MRAETPSTMVTGGVVAYNDAPHLAGAVSSLVKSDLPSGYAWDRIWIVVSPSQDGTVEVARALAAQYREVAVLEEPERRGKAAALREILRRATGRYLVLLNGDARAQRTATTALILAAEGSRAPVAAMARPVPFGLGESPLDSMISLLWDLHHDFHVRLLRSGRGSHISDEMMLVAGIDPEALPDQVITDGGFIGEWVHRHSGRVAYPVDAQVAITPAASFRDHLVQRIRIERGHRQFGRLAGHPADTLGREALRDPGGIVTMIRLRVRSTSHGRRSLALLLTTELCANVLATAAELVARPVPFRWPRITGRPPWSEDRAGQRDEQPVF